MLDFRADPRSWRNAALQASLAVAIAGAATTALILLALGSTLVRLSVAAAVAALPLIILSGNARLSCLYGLVLTAPLSLGKNFMVVPHMGGAFSYRIDLVDVFIIVLLGFQLHDLLVGHRGEDALRLPRVCVPWIGLMLLGGLFIVLGPYRSVTAHELLRMFKCLLLFLVLVNEVLRIKQFGHVVVALMLAVLVQVVVGGLQYGRNHQLGLEALGEGDEMSVRTSSHGTLVTGEFVNRVGGLLGNSNVLAAFLSLMLPIGISLLFTQIDVRIRALCFVTVVSGTGVLLVTLSRTGWVGFGVAFVGVLALGTFNRRTRERYALRRALTVAVMVVILLAFSRAVFLRLFYSDSEAVRSRLQWVGVAWNMVKDKPVFGHGLNHYVFLQAPYTRYGNMAALQKKYGTKLLPVVHNNYLLVWAEQGTIGFLMFLALQFQVVRLGWRNLRVRHETLFALNVGCLCGLGAMMVDWLASFSLRIDVPTRMYWILVGILCAIDYWHRANARARAAGHGAPPSGAWPQAVPTVAA